MSRQISLSFVDDDGTNVNISYKDDGTIIQQLQHFRELLLAMSFSEKLVNKYFDSDEIYS